MSAILASITWQDVAALTVFCLFLAVVALRFMKGR